MTHSLSRNFASIPLWQATVVIVLQACAALGILTAATVPQGIQAPISVPRVESLPNRPNNWRVLSFRGKALTMHHWIFADEPGGASGISAFFNLTSRSAWYSGSVASFPAYLGLLDGVENQPGQALCTAGLLFGAATLGAKQSKVPIESLGIYADIDGVVWNNPVGAGKIAIPTFWYGLINQYMIYATFDLENVSIRHEMLRKSVSAWSAATAVMRGERYDHVVEEWCFYGTSDR